MITVERRACPRIVVQAPDYSSWAIDPWSLDSSDTRCGFRSCSGSEPGSGLPDVMDATHSFESEGSAASSPKRVEAAAAFTRWSQQFKDLMHATQPEWPTFGQIWTTKLLNDRLDGASEDLPARIVVILDSGQQPAESAVSSVVSAPISTDVEFRSDRDLLVDESESPLGYEFMVEVWNEVAMLRNQLGRCVATLSSPIDRRLGLLYRSHLGLDTDLVELGRHIGPPIVHRDDPRVAFQEREIEACEHLRRPLLALARDEAAEESPSPERVWLSGSAVRSARRRLGLDFKPFRERVTSYGYVIDAGSLSDLEADANHEVASELVQILAQVLNVKVADLVAAGNGEHDAFAGFFARADAQGLVSRRARELGLSAEAATARARRELASAAARETRGPAQAHEWLRMLRTLLGTWKA
jgi:hypothetical protein